MKKQILHYKRILAGLLSAAMVFGAIPNPVFAEELIADESVVEMATEDEEIIIEDAVAEEIVTDEDDYSANQDASEEVIIDEELAVADEVELTLSDAGDEDYVNVDIESLAEDIMYVPTSGAYAKEADGYVPSTSENALYAKKGDSLTFRLSVNDAVKETKEVYYDSVAISANGIKDLPNEENPDAIAFAASEGEVTITVPDIDDDIKVAAQTTDIHTITVTGDKIKEVDPIKFSGKFSGNTYVDEELPIEALEGYLISKVTYKYAADEIELDKADDGKYYLPITEVGNYNYDFIVKVETKKDKFVLSYNGTYDDNVTAVKYGATKVVSDNSIKVDANKDITLTVEVGTGLKATTLKYNVGEEEKSLAISGGTATIPAADVVDDIAIKEVVTAAATYTVKFNNPNFYNKVSGNGVATYGKDYFFTVKPVEGYSEVKMCYSYNESFSPYLELTAENGVYKIPGEAVTGNIYICSYDKVAATYAISLAKEVAGVSVNALSANGTWVKLTTAKTTGIATANTDLRLKVKNDKAADSDLVLTAKSGDLSVDVYDDGYDEEGYAYYAIESTSIVGDIVINVAMVTKTYEVFAVSANGATIADNAQYVNAVDDGPADLARATKGQDYKVYVKAQPGYKLSYVKAFHINEDGIGDGIEFKGGAAISENSVDGLFTIEKKNVTSDILFEVHAEKIPVNIKVVSGNAVVTPVTAVTPTEDGWKVSAREDLEFTVTEDETYTVKKVEYLVDGYAIVINQADGKYKIDADNITKDMTIRVTTAKNVTLVYDDCISVSAVAENRVLPVTPATKKIEVGSTVDEIIFTAALTNDGYLDSAKKVPAYSVALTSVSANSTKEIAKTDKNGQATVKTADVDDTIIFNPTALNNVVIKKDGVVQSDKTVTVTADDYAAWSIVSYNGIDPTASEALTFTAADAGKSIKKQVKVDGRNVTLTFNVKSALKSVSIKEFKKVGTEYVAEQAAGTDAKYTVVVNPSNADTTGLKISVNGVEKTSMLTNNQLTVTAKADATPVEITVAAPGVAEFEGTVKPNYKALESSTPSVSLEYATSLELKLKLGLPKNVSKDTKDHIGYIVSANKLDEKGNETGSIITNYYTTTTDSISVLNSVTAETEPTKGKAAKYNVYVTLVQTNASEDTYYAASKTVKKQFATLDPYWETKLSATKKTTKLYWGQNDVVIAIPKFSNKTTWRDLDHVEVIEDPNGDFVTAWVDDETGYVMANAGETSGTYTVRLYATCPVTVAPATTDVKITVVPSITNWNTAIDVAKETYKPANKAITISPKVVYPYKDSQPATKKFVWSLDNASHDSEDTLKAKGITINKNNGKISVAKNYVVSSATGDTYTIKLKANDYAANTTEITKDVTITSKALELKKIQIDGKDVKAGTYKCSEVWNEPITVVGADGNVITDLSRYTIKSNNAKKCELYFNSSDNKNYIYAYPGKYTITATANDGGKSKITAKIEVGYSAESLKVTVAENDDIADNYPDKCLIYDSNKSKALNGLSMDSSLYVRVNTSDWEAMNASIAISGAKIIRKNEYAGFSEFTILPNNAVTKITVTNKVTKAKDVYTIDNHNFATLKATKAFKIDNKSDKLYVGTVIGRVQTAKFKVKANELERLKVGEGEGVRAIVTPELSQLETKNGYMQWGTWDAIRYAVDGNLDSSSVKVEVDENGEFKLPLVRKYIIEEDYYTQLYACTTKFNVELRKYDKSTGLDIETLAKSTQVSVKLDKVPNAKLQLTSSYKFEGSSVKLTAKLTNCTTNLTARNGEIPAAELYNANINGGANKFTDYFGLDANGNLYLKQGRNVLSDKSLKNNLTGFVKVTYVHTVTGESRTEYIKITCK